MAVDPDIRRVTVEFLRAGSPHNQLLSPSTPYLAVCEAFPAEVVHVPYEHRDVENLLSDLRYAVPAGAARLRESGTAQATLSRRCCARSTA